MTDDDVDIVFKLQNVWAGIDGRCNRPGQRSYDEYGAKGVKLCDGWSGRQGCIVFVKWAINNGWMPGLTIDRIDSNRGYSPDNCRCVTHQENCWNKKNNNLLTYNGETKCCAEWGHDPQCMVHSAQFQQRIKCGWSMEQALFTPLYGNKNDIKITT